MSRVDALINELAPGGVEFKALASLGRRNSGTAMTAARMRTIATVGGPVRIFAGGQTIADVAEDAVPAKDIIREPSIIVKSRGHVGFTYYERPFTHKAELWSYTLTDPIIDQKFVYYYLLTKVEQLQEIARATSVKLPQLGVRDTDTLRIPVPPLEVQREIVEILDRFTELDAELEAELEARLRQYAHYRDHFLALVDSARRVPMDELTEGIASGTNKSRTDDGRYPVYGSAGLLGYCDRPAFSGDALLVARVGAYAGRVYAVTGNFDVSDNTLVVRPTPEWNVRFAFHQLTRMDLNQYAVGGGQPLVTGGLLKRLEVPVPPLEEQVRIAEILDKFDALVNDLSIGLPAELNARRKQYEHYRDRLLTFREAA